MFPTFQQVVFHSSEFVKSRCVPLACLFNFHGEINIGNKICSAHSVSEVSDASVTTPDLSHEFRPLCESTLAHSEPENWTNNDTIMPWESGYDYSCIFDQFSECICGEHKQLPPVSTNAQAVSRTQSLDQALIETVDPDASVKSESVDQALIETVDPDASLKSESVDQALIETVDPDASPSVDQAFITTVDPDAQSTIEESLSPLFSDTESSFGNVSNSSLTQHFSFVPTPEFENRSM